MAIGTTLKTIQDIMRKDAGVDGDAQRLSQLVWMIFLKVMDDSEREKEMVDDDYKSPLPARFRWRESGLPTPQGSPGRSCSTSSTTCSRP